MCLPESSESLGARRLQGALSAALMPEAAARAVSAMALAGPEPPAVVVRAIEPEGLDALLATGLVRRRGWRLVCEHRSVLQEADRLAKLLTRARSANIVKTTKALLNFSDALLTSYQNLLLLLQRLQGLIQ